MFDPWEALDRQGADALRWFMITNGSPWASRRIGHEVLDEVVRQFLLTLWNVYAFFVTYANADGLRPRSRGARPVADRPLLDRWVLSQLATTVAAARDGLEAYDATGAGRRDRSASSTTCRTGTCAARAAASGTPPASAAPTRRAAFHTLYECLVTVATAARAVHAVRRRGAVAEPRRRPGRTRPTPSTSPTTRRPTRRARRSRTRRGDGRRPSIVELGRTVRIETKTQGPPAAVEAVVHYPGDHARARPRSSTWSPRS